MKPTCRLAMLTAVCFTALAWMQTDTAVAQATKHGGHHSVSGPSIAVKKGPVVGVPRSGKIAPVVKHGPTIKSVPMIKHAPTVKHAPVIKHVPAIKHAPAMKTAPIVKHAHRKWRPGLKWRWLVVPSIIIAESLDWCHYHRYPVSGMRFHRSVECHQHTRWNHPSIRYVEGY